MTLIDRLQRRRIRRRRAREAKDLAGNPLREFVYLDEVSVYSLVASRKGPIATDYRDTTSTLLRSEIASSGGANVGVAKADISSTVGGSQTDEMQIVRKAVIQSTFRELYNTERDALALKLTDTALAPEPPRDLQGLRALISTRGDEGWVVDPADLTRGQMVEVDVELRADRVFGFSTAFEVVLDMVQGNSTLTSHISESSLRSVVDINRVLQRLLVGLVPLQCRCVHYRSVVVDGREWLLHQHLLDRMPSGDVEPGSVFLVGVAEQQLFWKDIRRILFSRSRYLVLARLGRDGVQTDWSPVKSLAVLEDVLPGLARPIADAIQTLPTNMANSETSDGTSARDRMLEVLVRYGVAIAAHYGYELAAGDEDLVAVGATVIAGLADASEFADRRLAFGDVANHVVTRFDLDLDPAWATDLRKALQIQAGLWPPTAYDWPSVGTSEPGAGGVTVPAREGDAARYLDAEIVAVYW